MASIDIEYGSSPGLSVLFYGTVSADYTGKTGTKKRDVWGDGGASKTIVLNKTVTAQNVLCDGDLKITATTVDSSGKTQTYTGTNSLDFSVPSALPANVTITNDKYPDTQANIYYNGIEPLSAVFGSGSNSEFLYL